MRVIFGKLEHMIEELKDRLIHEIRVEPIRKTRAIEGARHVTLIVSVEALLEKELIATYHRGVFAGLWPMEDAKQQEALARSEARAEAIRKELSETFTVRLTRRAPSTAATMTPTAPQQPTLLLPPL